ncbi:MAG: arginine--tRNA ligase [Candidatus Dojkabacteria bacterium]|jgi:arginyl-tRNA synthetase
MDITKKITELISEAILSLDYDIPTDQIDVEKPNNPDMGEYSTNVAMKFAKVLKKNPVELAKEIVEKIPIDEDIEKVEVAGPGFINFYLSDKYLVNEIKKIAELGDEYFKSDENSGKNVLIEYTDANPFKVLHVGHLYTNVVGESFCRLQEVLGTNVKRVIYQGDVGLHVAKTMWGVVEKFAKEGLTIQDIEKRSLSERVKFLGEAYILGADAYDDGDDLEIKDEIDNINYYIFSFSIPSLPKKDFSKYEEVGMKEIYLKGRQWCLDRFEEIYQVLGTKFDYYFLESEVGERGLNIVKENIGKVFEEDDGAVVYRGDTEKNLHTRVFLNKYGLPTYEAKELGLALAKYEQIKYDESIIITGKEQKGYFEVVLDALRKISPEAAEGLVHVHHGWIKTPGGKKMASRKGGYVSGEDLLNEVIARVEGISNDSSKQSRLGASACEKIAVGAVKYAFLRSEVGNDIVFDLEKSISFDGDTGPYIMYAYSRCNSILEKIENIENVESDCNYVIPNNPEVRDLMARLSESRFALLDSARRYSPSTLCQYLFSLAQQFSVFYQNVRVLDAPESEKAFLVILLKAVMNVIKTSLYCLGIETVEKM